MTLVVVALAALTACKGSRKLAATCIIDRSGAKLPSETMLDRKGKPSLRWVWARVHQYGGSPT